MFREGGKKEKAPCRHALPRTMHFISGSTHLPSHLTRSGLSPNTGNFSEEWAWGLCCSPLDNRLYINSGEDRCSSEHCLLFAFFCFSFIHSVLFFLWKRQKHYSCPCWISCADLSVCISQSLVQPFNQTTVLLCWLSKSPFFFLATAILPPCAPSSLYVGCSSSCWDYSY